MNSLIGVRHIIRSQEAIAEMGRRRFQHPKIQKTTTKDKSAQRWYFRARVDVLTGPGETERPERPFYIGKVSEMNRREAEKRRDELCDKYINRPDVLLGSQVLFGTVLDRWLKTAAVKQSTLNGYKSIVNAHLRPQWGNVCMADITPMAVEEWLVAKSRTCSRAMLSTIRYRFTQVWKRAIFWQFTKDACPVIGMQRIAECAKPTRAKTLPTIEQYRHFLYLLDEPFRSLVVVCTFCGLRISEAMALTVAQLRSETTTIYAAVNQRTGKVGPVKTDGSARTIPIAHIRGDIFIPTDAASADRPYMVGYFPVYAALKEAARLAGIDYPGFGAHTFRRMHNTLFRRSAVDEAAVKLAMKQLGHAEAATNDLYMVEDESDIARRAGVAEVVRQKVMETVN